MLPKQKIYIQVSLAILLKYGGIIEKEMQLFFFLNFFFPEQRLLLHVTGFLLIYNQIGFWIFSSKSKRRENEKHGFRVKLLEYYK